MEAPRSRTIAGRAANGSMAWPASSVPTLASSASTSAAMVKPRWVNPA